MMSLDLQSIVISLDLISLDLQSFVMSLDVQSIAQVDVESPDLTKYPEFSRAEAREFLLHAGTTSDQLISASPSASGGTKLRYARLAPTRKF